MEENKKLAVSVEEAADMLGVGRSIAYQLSRSDGFPTVRIGRRVLVPLAELRAWLAERAGKGD